MAKVVVFMACAVLLPFVMPTSILMPQTDHHNEFNKGISSFAGNLYAKCAAKTDGNVIISPLSVASVLSLLLQGADGHTFHQIQQAFGLTGDKATIAHQFELYFEQLGIKDAKALLIANRLYVQNGVPIKQTFRDTIVEKLHFDIGHTNFVQASESARMINAFVESKTNHHIKHLISPAALGPHTRLVGVNAVYFKGDWKHKFQKSDTLASEFFVDYANAVQVDFMHMRQDLHFTRLDELDASVLELEYANSPLSFFVVLPDSRIGLPTLEGKLKNFDFKKITDTLFKAEVNVALPKFKVEFELSLKEALHELGMVDMFTNSANFNSMLDTNEQIKVSDVVHKAFIEINEDGVRAAAATGSHVTSCSMALERHFNADHPFAYYIMDKRTNAIVFSGRFTGL